MRIENQVCTLEQAKKLKELSIIQKSLFYYHPVFDKPVFGETMITVGDGLIMVCNDKKKSFSAFTVAELGVMLPDYVIYKKYGDNEFTCKVKGTNDTFFSDSKNEAEARANMLVYLIENKDIKIDEINQKLTERITA